VRAKVLAKLLCGAVEVEPGHAGVVHLARARVVGKLDLPGATFKYPLQLDECYVGDGIDLSDAAIRTLDLKGCHVAAIRLDGAKVHGALSLRGAHLNGQDKVALSAQWLTVTASRDCPQLS
jgi:hypothetical protein